MRAQVRCRCQRPLAPCAVRLRRAPACVCCATGCRCRLLPEPASALAHLPRRLPSGAARPQKRKEKANAGLKGKEDGLTPAQRKERDAKALQEKQAAKAAAQAAKAGN